VKDFDAFESKLTKLCIASGGTRFPVPLNRIEAIVRERQLQELQVIFLTDGMDNVRDETTVISA
jgi:uncharacterized protein with von Willebrand factor type A (vWA) domain